MKHEWRKHEKAVYLPGTTPQIIDVPTFNFLTIKGAGNPNTPAFANYIQALYATSYAIKMTLKKSGADAQPADYTVYPLEGVWDVSDAAKKRQAKELNKDDLVFTLMIRQPDFVSPGYAAARIADTIAKKSLPLLDKVKFETLTEGKCVQMMHIGSFDTEPESFVKMEDFATSRGLTRVSKIHREIYISDFRKVVPEKLKTVLRFQVR